MGNEAEAESIPVNLTQPLALCSLSDRISYRAALVEIPAQMIKKGDCGGNPGCSSVYSLAHKTVVWPPLSPPLLEKKEPFFFLNEPVTSLK